jgi:hypothetical protein
MGQRRITPLEASKGWETALRTGDLYGADAGTVSKNVRLTARTEGIPDVPVCLLRRLN